MQAEELLSNYRSGVRDFSAILLCEANLSRANLSQANLSQAILSITNLSGANLSGVDLSHAKLNVSKLSGADLSKANLSSAILNVANLIRAHLNGANLNDASLIRAELVRADLDDAVMTGANLSEADLREATLRRVNLCQGNLNGANLRGAILTECNLSQANLHGADLSRADLRGANLANAELRQVNLAQANLSGANLRGANLRWVDLNGAILAGADLEQAKLSGANLHGAELRHANLQNAILIHADLTGANLINADWTGADLTGALLTGAKLHNVSRFDLKAEEVTCDWVDLSPNGDGTKISHLGAEQARRFFNATAPTLEIQIDIPLDANAHCALANTYRYIMRHFPIVSVCPSIQVDTRRTLLSFRIEEDENLFVAAYVCILPFKDAASVQTTIDKLLRMLTPDNCHQLNVQLSHQIVNLGVRITQQIRQFASFALTPLVEAELEVEKGFFHSPTRVILKNAEDQSLTLYRHALFGRRYIDVPELAQISRMNHSSKNNPNQFTQNQLIEYMKCLA
ncbi:MAG: pentapeptide repeat-containing protein [Microcoleaceae cyanobacterium]